MFGSSSNHSLKRLKADDLSVDRAAYPGWMTAAERMPAVGDVVYCAAGLAKVVKLCGKTGDGTRLLELKIGEGKTPPFFAAASNVLVRPAELANVSPTSTSENGSAFTIAPISSPAMPASLRID